MNLGEVDYTSQIPPPLRYACTTCGAYGCKLWREYQTCADDTILECCDCAGISQKMDVSAIDSNGDVPQGDVLDGMRGCSIRWRVPAIPTEDGCTFWGYTSVEAVPLAWWRRLPTRTLEKLEKSNEARCAEVKSLREGLTKLRDVVIRNVAAGHAVELARCIEDILRGDAKYETWEA